MSLDKETIYNNLYNKLTNLDVADIKDNLEEKDNSLEEIQDSFKKAKKELKPSAIIAHTIKGKGVSFMEDNNNWHYRIPNQDELKMALEELGFFSKEVRILGVYKGDSNREKK